jgi:AraC family transcriptional activator of pobA
MPPAPIPQFFLYGEAPRVVGDRFLHLETLDERSRPANWNIRPHSHDRLNHVIHIRDGGGRMFADARTKPFRAPCLLVLPSHVVHGFAFAPDTLGRVLTVSDRYLNDHMAPRVDTAGLFAEPRVLPLTSGEAVEELLARLAIELAWAAPGHAEAVEALLVLVLVETLRAARQAPADSSRRGGAAALVARFRGLVEARHRSETRVEAYAAELGVSAKRLRHACARAASTTPLRIIHDRLLLEARRLLLYSNMTVSEVAYFLGFDDPAYFTRMFTKATGVSPRAFRAQPPEAS